MKSDIELVKRYGRVPENDMSIHPSATIIYPSFFWIFLEWFFVNNIKIDPKTVTVVAAKEISNHLKFEKLDLDNEKLEEWVETFVNNVANYDYSTGFELSFKGLGSSDTYLRNRIASNLPEYKVNLDEGYFANDLRWNLL